MKFYLFTRQIPKREAIDKYGKMGWREHAEGVFIYAENEEEAKKLIAPFNYKKHIRFTFDSEIQGIKPEDNIPIESIIDFGLVEDQ